MARRLPPLNSLKSFEAAGRLLSFTRAADELNVTQAAISHQIKLIEEFLGVSLFERYPRRLALTESGKILLSDLSTAFDKISAAVKAVSKDQADNKLTVRLAPSLASKWLSPKLKYFNLQYPEIDLCLFHAHAMVDFEREKIDIAVAYGKGFSSDFSQQFSTDVVAEPLFSQDYFPVCAPSFMFNDKPLNDINNIRYYNLLHDASYQCWEEWLVLAGIDGINAHKGMINDDTNVLIQAAVDGQGIALGSMIFVEDLLKSGALIKPFDITLSNAHTYYIVYPAEHLKNPAVKAFRDWLLSLSEGLASAV